MRRKLAAALAAGGVLAGAATTTGVLAAAPGAQAAPATATAAATATPPYCQGPLAELAASGTITQAQAAAIRAAMISYMRDHRAGFTPGAMAQALRPGGPLASILGQMARNGTITPAQATAVSKAITEQMREHWQTGTGQDGRGPAMMGGAMMSGAMMSGWHAGPQRLGNFAS